MSLGLSVVAIRVIYAEDSALLREGVIRVLGATDDVELIATCTNEPEVLAAVAADQPDVVVTDIRMPPTHTDEGVRIARHLQATMPGVGVVVLSQHADPSYAHTLLECGSQRRAYLLKDRVADPGQLVAAIRTVHMGGSMIDPLVVEALVSLHATQKESPLRTLTGRESDILREMAQGRSNAAIAATLGLTERAVEKHSNTLFAKLHLNEEPDVNRRVKAVLLYLTET